jgi:hypothetical protein
VSILGLVTEDRHELALFEGRADTVIPAIISFSRASSHGSKSISKSADETGSAIRIIVTISLAETETLNAEAINVQRLEWNFNCRRSNFCRSDTVIPAYLSFSSASTDGTESMISLLANKTASAIVIGVTISLAETKTMLAEAMHVQRLEFVRRSRGFRGLSFNH